MQVQLRFPFKICEKSFCENPIYVKCPQFLFLLPILATITPVLQRTFYGLRQLADRFKQLFLELKTNFNTNAWSAFAYPYRGHLTFVYVYEKFDLMYQKEYTNIISLIRNQDITGSEILEELKKKRRGLNSLILCELNILLGPVYNRDDNIQSHMNLLEVSYDDLELIQNLVQLIYYKTRQEDQVELAPLFKQFSSFLLPFLEFFSTNVFDYLQCYNNRHDSQHHHSLITAAITRLSSTLSNDKGLTEHDISSLIDALRTYRSRPESRSKIVVMIMRLKNKFSSEDLYYETLGRVSLIVHIWCLKEEEKVSVKFLKMGTVLYLITAKIYPRKQTSSLGHEYYNKVVRELDITMSCDIMPQMISHIITRLEANIEDQVYIELLQDFIWIFQFVSQAIFRFYSKNRHNILIMKKFYLSFVKEEIEDSKDQLCLWSRFFNFLNVNLEHLSLISAKYINHKSVYDAGMLVYITLIYHIFSLPSKLDKDFKLIFRNSHLVLDVFARSLLSLFSRDERMHKLSKHTASCAREVIMMITKKVQASLILNMDSDISSLYINSDKNLLKALSGVLKTGINNDVSLKIIEYQDVKVQYLPAFDVIGEWFWVLFDKESVPDEPFNFENIIRNSELTKMVLNRYKEGHMYVSRINNKKLLDNCLGHISLLIIHQIMRRGLYSSDDITEIMKVMLTDICMVESSLIDDERYTELVHSFIHFTKHFLFFEKVKDDSFIFMFFRFIFLRPFRSKNLGPSLTKLQTQISDVNKGKEFIKIVSSFIIKFTMKFKNPLYNLDGALRRIEINLLNHKIVHERNRQPVSIDLSTQTKIQNIGENEEYKTEEEAEKVEEVSKATKAEQQEKWEAENVPSLDCLLELYEIGSYNFPSDAYMGRDLTIEEPNQNLKKLFIENIDSDMFSIGDNIISNISQVYCSYMYTFQRILQFMIEKWDEKDSEELSQSVLAIKLSIKALFSPFLLFASSDNFTNPYLDLYDIFNKQYQYRCLILESLSLEIVNICDEYKLLAEEFLDNLDNRKVYRLLEMYIHRKAIRPELVQKSISYREAALIIVLTLTQSFGSKITTQKSNAECKFEYSMQTKTLFSKAKEYILKLNAVVCRGLIKCVHQEVLNKSNGDTKTLYTNTDPIIGFFVGVTRILTYMSHQIDVSHSASNATTIIEVPIYEQLMLYVVPLTQADLCDESYEVSVLYNIYVIRSMNQCFEHYCSNEKTDYNELMLSREFVDHLLNLETSVIARLISKNQSKLQHVDSELLDHIQTLLTHLVGLFNNKVVIGAFIGKNKFLENIKSILDLNLTFVKMFELDKILALDITKLNKNLSNLFKFFHSCFHLHKRSVKKRVEIMYKQIAENKTQEKETGLQEIFIENKDYKEQDLIDLLIKEESGSNARTRLNKSKKEEETSRGKFLIRKAWLEESFTAELQKYVKACSSRGLCRHRIVEKGFVGGKLDGMYKRALIGEYNMCYKACLSFIKANLDDKNASIAQGLEKEISSIAGGTHSLEYYSRTSNCSLNQLTTLSQLVENLNGFYSSDQDILKDPYMSSDFVNGLVLLTTKILSQLERTDINIIRKDILSFGCFKNITLLVRYVTETSKLYILAESTKRSCFFTDEENPKEGSLQSFLLLALEIVERILSVEVLLNKKLNLSLFETSSPTLENLIDLSDALLRANKALRIQFIDRKILLRILSLTHLPKLRAVELQRFMSLVLTLIDDCIKLENFAQINLNISLEALIKPAQGSQKISLDQIFECSQMKRIKPYQKIIEVLKLYDLECVVTELTTDDNKAVKEPLLKEKDFVVFYKEDKIGTIVHKNSEGKAERVNIIDVLRSDISPVCRNTIQQLFQSLIEAYKFSEKTCSHYEVMMKKEQAEKDRERRKLLEQYSAHKLTSFSIYIEDSAIEAVSYYASEEDEVFYKEHNHTFLHDQSSADDDYIYGPRVPIKDSILPTIAISSLICNNVLLLPYIVFQEVDLSQFLDENNSVGMIRTTLTKDGKPVTLLEALIKLTLLKDINSTLFFVGCILEAFKTNLYNEIFKLENSEGKKVMHLRYIILVKILGILEEMLDADAIVNKSFETFESTLLRYNIGLVLGIIVQDIHHLPEYQDESIDMISTLLTKLYDNESMISRLINPEKGEYKHDVISQIQYIINDTMKHSLAKIDMSKDYVNILRAIKTIDSQSKKQFDSDIKSGFDRLVFKPTEDLNLPVDRKVQQSYEKWDDKEMWEKVGTKSLVLTQNSQDNKDFISDILMPVNRNTCIFGNRKLSSLCYNIDTDMTFFQKSYQKQRESRFDIKDNDVSQSEGFKAFCMNNNYMIFSNIDHDWKTDFRTSTKRNPKLLNVDQTYVGKLSVENEHLKAYMKDCENKIRSAQNSVHSVSKNQQNEDANRRRDQIDRMKEEVKIEDRIVYKIVTGGEESKHDVREPKEKQLNLAEDELEEVDDNNNNNDCNNKHYLTDEKEKVQAEADKPKEGNNKLSFFAMQQAAARNEQHFKSKVNKAIRKGRKLREMVCVEQTVKTLIGDQWSKSDIEMIILSFLKNVNEFENNVILAHLSKDLSESVSEEMQSSIVKIKEELKLIKDDYSQYEPIFKDMLNKAGKVREEKQEAAEKVIAEAVDKTDEENKLESEEERKTEAVPERIEVRVEGETNSADADNAVATDYDDNVLSIGEDSEYLENFEKFKFVEDEKKESKDNMTEDDTESGSNVGTLNEIEEESKKDSQVPEVSSNAAEGSVEVISEDIRRVITRFRYDDDFILKFCRLFFVSYNDDYQSTFLRSLYDGVCSNIVNCLKILDIVMFVLYTPEMFTEDMYDSKLSFPPQHMYDPSGSKNPEEAYVNVCSNILYYLNPNYMKNAKTYLFTPVSCIQYSENKLLDGLKERTQYHKKIENCYSVVDMLIGLLEVPQVMSSEEILSTLLTTIKGVIKGVKLSATRMNIHKNGANKLKNSLSPKSVALIFNVLAEPKSNLSADSVKSLRDVILIIKEQPKLVIACKAMLVKQFLASVSTLVNHVEDLIEKLKTCLDSQVTNISAETLQKFNQPEFFNINLFLVLFTSLFEQSLFNQVDKASELYKSVIKVFDDLNSNVYETSEVQTLMAGLFELAYVISLIRKDKEIKSLDSVEEPLKDIVITCIAFYTMVLMKDRLTEQVKTNTGAEAEERSSRDDLDQLPSLKTIRSKSQIYEEVPKLSETFSYCRKQEQLDFHTLFIGFAIKYSKMISLMIDDRSTDNYENMKSVKGMLTMILEKCPWILDLKTKRKLLKANFNKYLERFNITAYTYDARYIEVDRKAAVISTLRKFSNISQKVLMQYNKITYKGESGVDGGGLRREFYTIMSKELFNPQNGLFILTDNGVALQPSPYSAIVPDHLLYLELSGIILAKAIVDETVMDITLSRPFLKHILGKNITIADMEHIDSKLGKNLEWILENEVNELYLTYTYETEVLGKRVVIELVEGGNDVLLDQANKKDYVKEVCKAKMIKEASSQLKTFMRGFRRILPAHLLSFFTTSELEMIITGEPYIDFNEMKETAYTSYGKDHKITKWLWEILEEFDQEKLADFLFFVTGSVKVGHGGFKENQIRIGKLSNKESLPVGHTCSRQIDIPEFDTKEKLREKLLMALYDGAEGFYLS